MKMQQTTRNAMAMEPIVPLNFEINEYMIGNCERSQKFIKFFLKYLCHKLIDKLCNNNNIGSHVDTHPLVKTCHMS